MDRGHMLHRARPPYRRTRVRQRKGLRLARARLLGVKGRALATSYRRPGCDVRPSPARSSRPWSAGATTRIQRVWARPARREALGDKTVGCSNPAVDCLYFDIEVNDTATLTADKLDEIGYVTAWMDPRTSVKLDWKFGDFFTNGGKSGSPTFSTDITYTPGSPHLGPGGDPNNYDLCYGSCGYSPDVYQSSQSMNMEVPVLAGFSWPPIALWTDFTANYCVNEVDTDKPSGQEVNTNTWASTETGTVYPFIGAGPTSDVLTFDPFILGTRCEQLVRG